MAYYENSRKSMYPLTKMNFLVTVAELNANAAFNEVTGIDASVDVVEFRQGNSGSLAPIKIPGLVKHGNITLKMGYTLDNKFRDWVKQCISEIRGDMPRKKITIELLNIVADGAPKTVVTSSQGSNQIWILENAWVTKYAGPDLNAASSEVAIESVELAYEELTIPK